MGRYRTDLTFRRITPEESPHLPGRRHRRRGLPPGRHPACRPTLLLDPSFRGPSRPRQGPRPRAHSRRGPAPCGHTSAVAVTMAGAHSFPGLRLEASFTRRVGRPLRAGLSAAIPARWRSREFTLLSLSPPLAGARCALRLPNKKGWAPMNAHPVVLSHCATRARCSNPPGPSLRSGLAQEGLGRAVKVADREDRLRVITDRLAWGTPAPEARGRRVGPALACGPARGGQHPGLCQVAPPCVRSSARAWAGADRRAPRTPP